MRLAGRPATLCALLALGAGACASGAATARAAHAPAAAPRSPSEQGPSARPPLRFKVTPEDARLSVNGRDLGPVEALGDPPQLRLVRGVYRVSLSREGYETWRGEVAVSEGETLEIALQPQP